MNTNTPPEIDDREWQAQERGMRAARGRDADRGDAVVASYRRVAVVLTRAPRAEPPADFTSAVVEQVAGGEAGIERALLRSLVLLLAISAAIVTARYGGQWWQAMQHTFTGSLQWALAGAGCAALSWIMARLPRPGRAGR